jgi:O-antigen/teichoic acid export membrane protein
MAADAGREVRESPPIPNQGLTRRACLNAAASLAVFFTQVAVALVTSPILLRGLGSSLFGVWQMLGRLVAYMSAADGRPTEALRLVIAHHQGEGNVAVKRRYVGSALFMWILSLPVLAIAGAVLTWFSPAITKVPPESYSAVRLTCGLLVVNFLLSNLVALPESVLRGMNLGYRRLSLQAGLVGAGGCLMAGALYLGMGLVGLAAAQVLLSCLTGVLFWAVVKKFVPWFGAAVPTWAEISSFVRVSVWSLVGTIVAKIHLGSDLIILGVLASTSSVTTYVLTGYAADAATPILSLLFVAVGPGLGGLIAQHRYAKAAAVLEEMLAMNWLLVTAVGSAILAWNRSFLHLWVGDEYYAGPWIDLLIVFIMMQMVTIRTHSCVINAALQVRKRVIVNAIAAFLSIGLMVALTPFWGITGVCIGILGGRLVQWLLLPLVVRSCLQSSRRIWSIAVARRGLVLCILFAASACLGHRHLADSWPALVACVAASLALTSGVALFTGLSADCRSQLLQRVRSVWVPVQD